MQFYDYITDFIFVDDQPEKADIIFVPGGPYPDSARHAAKLYLQGYAPYIMPSGKYSILKEKLELSDAQWKELLDGRTKSCDVKLTLCENRNKEVKETDRKAELEKELRTESDYLCEIMKQSGVPEAALIRENQAAYTYENAVYSRKKLKELGISVKKAILCCQAFHARRSLLYYQEQFPDVTFLVCPVVTKGISRDTWYQSEEGIDTVLGEMERCGSQFHEIMRQHMK